MRHLLKCLAAFILITNSVQAADLSTSAIKDPLPDSLSWYGLTLFGAVDVDAAYQTHGAGYSGSQYAGLAYNVFGNKFLTGPHASFSNNALQTSTIGLKIDEPLFAQWRAIGLLDTGFNPLSGELADACKSLIQNNGRVLTAQNTNGDAIRCGQALNGDAYGGVTHPTFGTLTVGRQFNLTATNILRAFDPLAGSPAFSLPTFSGGFLAGAGSPESAVWDASVRYFANVGAFHGGAMFTPGGEDQALHGSSYNFDLGATWQGFTIDATYLNERGGTAAFTYAPGACGTAFTPSCNTLNGTAFDSSEYSVGAKYTFHINGWIPSKLTFSGAYAHITEVNPSNPIAVGTTTMGGYAFGAINNVSFVTAKVLQTAWLAANYELANGWTFTGAFYYVNQGSYVTKFGPATIKTCTGSATANCAGNVDTASGVVDYAFDKHFDVYGGVGYSLVAGGLASGYLSNNTTTLLTGARLRF